MSEHHHVGQRLSFDGSLCTVRYIGDVAGTKGSWLGVEWDDASRGKHDGRHKNERYFECLSNSPTAASFVRPSRRADEPQSYVDAILQKYATEPGSAEGDGGSGRGSGLGSRGGRNPEIEIVYFGKKIAEEVGFDKIRRQFARIDELKIVILDGMRIAWDVRLDDVSQKSVRDTSPAVAELDMSRNMFETFGTVARICRELEGLKNLKLNGNCFQLIRDEDEESPGSAKGAFPNVTDLELEETLLSWDAICDVASNFPRLAKLSASLNQLTYLPPLSVGFGTLAATLTTLTFEFNEFTSLADLAPLASLTALESLHLKGNNISSIVPSSPPPPEENDSHPHAHTHKAPKFAPSLVFLDVSYNAIASWSFVDALPTSIPGLTALRINHNPIYTEPDATAAGTGASSAAGQGTTAVATNQPTKPLDEAYITTIARLPNLKSVNFTPVTTQERTNAELFYLSRIAKQLAAVPEDDEACVLAQHPLYAALCEVYGEPAIVRRDEVNSSFLEARLVNVKFKFMGGASTAASMTTMTTTPRGFQGQGEEEEEVMKAGGPVRTASTEIPRSFDVYAVKGIAGKLFGKPALSLGLVWETGEWDPVGGFDEEVGESSDDDEYDGCEYEQQVDAVGVKDQEKGAGEEKEGDGEREGEGETSQLGKEGRWVKREIELADGPRQLGFCVDGLEATIRVEVR